MDVVWMQGFFWGFLSGLAWARGSWCAAAAICSGRKSALPFVLKITTPLCLYFGLSLGRELWPQVLVGLVFGGASLMGLALLVSRGRLR